MSFNEVAWDGINLVNLETGRIVYCDLPIDTTHLPRQQYIVNNLRTECIQLIADLPAKLLRAIYHVETEDANEVRLTVIEHMSKLNGWALWKMLEQLKRAQESLPKVAKEYLE